jgi:hypothetical protein
MNNIDKLLERQREVNEKCVFKLDYNGLILGYYAEVGKLCSVVALYEGFKKPKPSDLEKFGRWDEVGNPDLKHNMYTVDFIFALPFEEAWNHEITKAAIKQEIADELADVLVYVLQLKLFVNDLLKLASGLPKLDEKTNLLEDLVVFRGETYPVAIDLISPASFLRLNKIAEKYEINLEKAYNEKIELELQKTKNKV